MTRSFNPRSHDAHTNPNIPPPAYTPRDSDGQQKTGELDKERLRRFLSHLLSLDYGVKGECPDKLEKSDWLRYVHLAWLAFTTFRSHHHVTCMAIILRDWSDGCCYQPEIDKYITRPARSLRIETKVVIVMLLNWIHRHEHWPAGSWIYRQKEDYGTPWLEETNGAKHVASKILRDRNSLFKTLVPPQETHYLSLLRRENIRKQDIWFERLESPTFHSLTDYGLLRAYPRPSQMDRYESEQRALETAFKLTLCMADAMQGFPDDPKPSWWKRGPTTWWAQACERVLFGEVSKSVLEV